MLRPILKPPLVSIASLPLILFNIDLIFDTLNRLYFIYAAAFSISLIALELFASSSVEVRALGIEFLMLSFVNVDGKVSAFLP